MNSTLFTIFIASITFAGLSRAKFDPIAFTVSHNTHWNVPNETTVPYPYTITNHMQRQEISNGIFTSREGGIFKCQVYSLSSQNGKMFLELWHNDRRVASLYGHTANSFATGGNAVVLVLAEGDTVQVKSRLNNPVGTFGTSDQIYNTFTCVQIGSEAISVDQNHIPAFSVTSNRNQNVVGGASIMYPTELYNLNNAFNLDTGEYKAPSAGVYIFHFFSLAHQNEELWQDLFKNGIHICSIKCVTDFEWADAGNTVILHLNYNDSVIVKAHAGVDNYLFGSSDQIYTTFSGVQVISDLDITSPESFPVVAFSVGLTHNITLGTGSSVPFDKVFVNYKHAYDISKSHFVAPASGLYEFNYHGRSSRGREIYLRLMHNQRYIDSIYSSSPGHQSTAGNAAVLELVGGDIVNVEAPDGRNHLYGDPNEIYCTFSGYLLHAISPAEIIVGK